MDEKNWTKTALQDEAYRRYQLNWMMDHGAGPRDLFLSVIGTVTGAADPEDADTTDVTKIDMDEAFRVWEADCGFDGSLWACKAEFLDSEYQDRDFMYSLLTADMYAAYVELWKNDALT